MLDHPATPPTRPTPSVVVIGDVVTDIVVRLREPLARASDTRSAIQVGPGGSGANQAAWLAGQGLDVHFVGRVGNDPFGAARLDELRAAGVTPHCAVDPERPTGTIVVLVEPDGERSMLTDRGANLALAPDDLPRPLFARGAHLHLSGYTLFDPATRAAGVEALRLARATGMRVSVDPSSASLLSDVGPRRFLEWTRGADYCFPNLEEGQLLGGASQPLAVARALLHTYGEVALKLGAGGALWAGATATKPLSLPAEPATVVDSTGAGDAFCAGFLAQRLAGAPPPEALAAGLHLAADAVSRVGARPPLPAPARGGHAAERPL